MFLGTAGAGSLYWLGLRDKDGAYLDGGKTYQLRVPQPVPQKLFWSVTVYDSGTRSQIQTDQDKAALSSLVELKDVATTGATLTTVRDQAQGHASSYHRVLFRRRWATWALARALITFLLDHVVPPGPVLLAGDDTVTEHPGPKVFGKGRHRDVVRSTHSYTAYRWGHKWVVVSALLKLPVATRPWALTVLAALYRPPEWDRLHGRRHKTPAHLVTSHGLSLRFGPSCLVLPMPLRRESRACSGARVKKRRTTITGDPSLSRHI
jgi:hypothetical protein